MNIPSLPAYQVIYLLFLSGWAAADTTAALQIMVGQPMVMGWLTGLLLGQPMLGFFMGVALQLLWSRLAPVGAAAYPDVGPATLTGVTVASLLVYGTRLDWPGVLFMDSPPYGYSMREVLHNAMPTPLSAMIGLLAALLAGRFGQILTILLRKDNVRLARYADKAAIVGSYGGVELANRTGVLRSFLRGVIIPLIMVPLFVLFVISIMSLTGSGHLKAGDDNPGILLFWWFGVAALTSVLWRGGRRDLGLLVGGAAAGVLLGILT